MGITSLTFLSFFLIVYGVYVFIPSKMRACWLLAASYGFCMSFGTRYALVLLISTAGTWLAGIFIERCQGKSLGRLIVTGVIALHILLLCFFKFDSRNLVLPVGISFYTFQAVGYLIDVYEGRVRPEHNVIFFGLFQSFFPKLVQGPIERSDGFLKQLHSLENVTLFDLQRIRKGLQLILWGLFEKLMIADRIAIPVNAVYKQFWAFGGVEILLATLLYAFQIYCDFAGYTNMACGIAQLCGIELTENFKRPYLAISVRDFWRRWHISLSSWLRDYVYIPLGGNRKGKLRKHINMMLTFLVSGIWHGTGFHFLAWGGMHGMAQILETKLSKAPKLLRWFLTFCFIDASWMVFRVNSLGDLRGMLWVVITDFRLRDPAGMELGGFEWLLLLLGILLIIGKDILNEKGISLRERLGRQSWLVRALIYTALLSGIVILGVYGGAYDTSGFLYTQF